MVVYYTLRQAMARMNVSRSKIMRLIKEGKLETFQPDGKNGSHTITQEHIDRYFRRGKVKENSDGQ